MNADSDNPFGTWNLGISGTFLVSNVLLVFWEYCGGTSHTSDREEPLVYNGTKLWFREKRVVDTILNELELMGSLLSEATDVVLTGTSAGALSTYLIASRVASMIPESANFAVMPDGGFFMDYPSYQV